MDLDVRLVAQEQDLVSLANADLRLQTRQPFVPHPCRRMSRLPSSSSFNCRPPPFFPELTPVSSTEIFRSSPLPIPISNQTPRPVFHPLHPPPRLERHADAGLGHLCRRSSATIDTCGAADQGSHDGLPARRTRSPRPLALPWRKAPTRTPRLRRRPPTLLAQGLRSRPPPSTPIESAATTAHPMPPTSCAIAQRRSPRPRDEEQARSHGIITPRREAPPT